MPYRRAMNRVPRKRNRFGFKKPRRVFKKGSGGTKLSKTVKNLVKDIINKGREKKVVDLLINNESSVPGLVGRPQSLEVGSWTGNYLQTSTSRDTWDVFPKLTQSATVAPSDANGAINRLGNVIQPLSFTVKGNVYLDPFKPNTNTNYCGMTMRVMVLSSKKYADYDALRLFKPPNNLNGYELTAAELLRTDGGVLPFVGVYSTMESFRINTPAIRVHAQKTFRIKQEQLFNWSDNINGSSLPGIPRDFNFNIKLPKKIKYGDNKDTTPEAISPFICCIYSFDNANDSSVPPQVDSTVPRFYWSSRLIYTDA